MRACYKPHYSTIEPHHAVGSVEGKLDLLCVTIRLHKLLPSIRDALPRFAVPVGVQEVKSASRFTYASQVTCTCAQSNRRKTCMDCMVC